VNKKYTELLNRLEDDLDEIADGREEWVPVLERFWKDFKERVDFVDESVTRDDVSEARVVGNDPTTGKPISVRYGKYGPFVQMGTKDDEEKPKFASLKANQRMDSVTLDEALELFKLPRTIGTTAEGKDIRVAIGRFGPYVQYGEKKFVSIKDDDPYTVELPRALELIKAKEELDANRTILDFPEAGIQVLNGRYGPYITDKVKNAKIPKDREPKTLTLAECKELIAAAPARGKGRFGRFAKKTAAPAAAPAAAEKPTKAAAKSKTAPPKTGTTTKAPAKTTVRAAARATAKPAEKTPARKAPSKPATAKRPAVPK
jgi:DNA topoisomerase-1